MSYVKIYFTENKKCFQIIRPRTDFQNDWSGLVDAVTRGNYYSFDVFFTKK